MSNPVDVVGVLDENSGSEAIYVAGTLRVQEYTVHVCEIAKAVEGLTIKFSHIVVELPDDADFPDKFDDVVKYTKVDD